MKYENWKPKEKVLVAFLTSMTVEEVPIWLRYCSRVHSRECFIDGDSMAICYFKVT